MATPLPLNVSLRPSGETPPRIRSHDPDGNVARLPAFGPPVVEQPSTSVPERVMPGETYTATTTLISGGTAGLRYSLEHGPALMTVDPFTGDINWPVPLTGPDSIHTCYNIVIKVSNARGFQLVYRLLQCGDQPVVYLGNGELRSRIGADSHNLPPSQIYVIRPGTYTGAENGFSYDQAPQGGTQQQRTCIIAERPGTVILDGGGQFPMMFISGDYDSPDFVPEGFVSSGFTRNFWDVSGMVIRNSTRVAANSIVFSCNVVRFRLHTCYQNVRSTDYGSGGLNIGFSRARGGLIEDSCSFGHNRYMMGAFLALECGAFNCTARNDIHDASDPIGAYSVYSHRDWSGANLIAVDSAPDMHRFWTQFRYHVSAFGTPATSRESWPRRLKWNDNIAVDYGAGFFVTGARFVTSRADSSVYNNCSAWFCDTTNSPLDGFSYPAIQTTSNDEISQITMGRIGCTTRYTPVGNGLGFINEFQGNPTTLRNSIFTEFGWDRVQNQVVDQGQFTASALQIGGIEFSVIHDLEGLLTNPAAPMPIADTINVDPYENGLEYSIYIQPGSMLDTAGRDGARVGATILWEKHTPNTIFGDPGYDDLADGLRPMWPRRNEDYHQQWMRQYSETGTVKTGGTATLSGNRGFCVDGQTLTNYVWEQTGRRAVPVFGLHARVTGGDNIEVMWQRGADKTGVRRLEFYVEQSFNDGPWTRIALKNPIEFNHVITGAAAGSYKFRVIARNITLLPSLPVYESETVVIA